MEVFRKLQDLLTKSEQRKALLLLLMMIIGMLLETFSIGLIVPLMTVMMSNSDSSNSFIHHIFSPLNGPAETHVLSGMLLLAGIYSLKSTFVAFLTWWQAKFSFGIQKHVSQRLFSTYMGQPYAFHLSINSAQLIRNATIEANLLTLSVSALLLLLTEILVILGIAILLVSIEPIGALIVISIFSVSGYAFLKLTRAKISRWGIDRQYHEGKRIQQLQQGFGSIKDVLISGNSEYFLNNYSRHNTETARVAANQMALQNMPRLFLESLAIVSLAIIVLVMTHRGLDFKSTLPTLALFAAAAFRLLPSANRVLQSIQTVRYGIPIIELLHHELNTPHKTDPQKVQPLPEFNSSIQLKSLTFSYANTSNPALENICLRINKSEFIGFIGTSGSGKSTLVDIILGLLTPQSGEIRIDGNDIKLSPDSWRPNIGYVPQTIYLTDDSIRRNIAFGIPDDKINASSLERAINAAQLSNFIAELDEGLDTKVGERGIRLSGGQRQRIGIARALYHDPEILVLDEATSALDTSTEESVMGAIDALHGKKTVIIVAHRLSTVSRCDRLYRFEQGKLVEETSPNEFFKKTK